MILVMKFIFLGILQSIFYNYSSLLLFLPQLHPVQSKRRNRARTRNRRKRNANARNLVTQSFLQIQYDCILQCDPQHMAENEMCITQCMNTACHDQIYTFHNQQLLEPGELDEQRAVAFEQCVMDEIMEMHQDHSRKIP